MLFCLDVEDRKRILALKSREDKFKKLMAPFLQLKYISIFGRPFCFIYGGSDILEEVAKQKFLGSRRYVKYDSNNKDHIFAVLSFYVALDIYLENPISFPFVQIIVNFHLKIIISMEQSTDVLYRAISSKLILTFAVIKVLCKRNNWTINIQILTQ